MVSTEFKGAGLHYTAFRDAIREDSRQITPSRGVSPRKKFAVEANVESRVSERKRQMATKTQTIEVKVDEELAGKIAGKAVRRWHATAFSDGKRRVYVTFEEVKTVGASA